MGETFLLASAVQGLCSSAGWRPCTLHALLQNARLEVQGHHLQQHRQGRLRDDVLQPAEFRRLALPTAQAEKRYLLGGSSTAGRTPWPMVSTASTAMAPRSDAARGPWQAVCSPGQPVHADRGGLPVQLRVQQGPSQLQKQCLQCYF